MFIGNPQRFAIEYEIDKYFKQWIFGRICYRINGERFGSFESGTALNSAIAAFGDLTRFRGCRGDPDLIQLSKADAFKRINDALYVDYGQSDGQVALDEKKYWRFHASHPGFDAFDKVRLYLIEDNFVGRMLWSRNESCIEEAVLRSGEFDDVLDEFASHIA